MPRGVYIRTEKHREICKKNGACRRNFIVSVETKNKIRDAQIGKPRYKIRGNKNGCWKGGVTSQDQIERTRVEYLKWREEVFLLSKKICIECGETKKKLLVVHHIKPFKEYPHLRYDKKNAQILCRRCHINHHRKELCLGKL